MDLNRKNTKNTGRRFLLFAAFLAFAVIQSGFAPLAYPNTVKQEIEPGRDISDINIIAELNGTPVSTLDLLRRFNLFSLMSGNTFNLRDRVSINNYLDSYFAEMLLLQEAKKMKISISRDEIEKEKKKYLEKKDIPEDEFLKSLKNMNLTMEDADRYFEKNLIALKFGTKKYGHKDISDEEAKKYYDRHIDNYIGPEKIAVSHILICHKDSIGCRSDLNKEQARELAENIQKLAKPENFFTLAKQYSTDTTGADGGDLGYISRGAAVPPFEKVAFNLKKGEISDVVETEFGYHIIYVTGKQKARSITFDEAKESIKKKLSEEYIAMELLKYLSQLLETADIKRYMPDLNKFAESEEPSTVSPGEFKTFKKTGRSINVNSKGQPVILFFGRAGCSHCQWVSDTYDSIVLEYMERGLIEAHHYDIETKDDLLTATRETKIPEEYLKIKDGKEPELVPYFNFGGSFERAGTGYESQDDFFAEEMEMRQVIDYLLKKK